MNSVRAGVVLCIAADDRETEGHIHTQCPGGLQGGSQYTILF